MPRRRKTGRSIWQRADGRWVTYLELPRDGGKRRRRAIYGASPEEVQKRLEAQQTLSKASRSQDSAPPTVGEAVRRHVASVEALVRRGKRKIRTLRVYQDMLASHIEKPIGGLKLRQATREALQRYLDGLSLGARSKEGLVRLLRASLRPWVGRVLPDDPTQGLELPDPPDEPPAYLSAEHGRILLDAVPTLRYGPLWGVLLLTGLRISEALGLCWTDVDFAGSTLTVRRQLARQAGQWRLIAPKTKDSAAQVPLTERAAEFLRIERTRQAKRLWNAGIERKPGGLVFTGRRDNPLNKGTIGWYLDRDCRALGLPRITPHGLRHSAASMLIAQGVHIRFVQEILRHSSYKITADTYSHVAPAALLKEARKLDKAYSKPDAKGKGGRSKKAAGIQSGQSDEPVPS